MDFFFIFSGLYLLSLLTLTCLVFLWILGATKTRNEARSLPPAPAPAPARWEPPAPAAFQPAHEVIPRRLSFSTPFATPTPLFSRRNLRTPPTRPPSSSRRRVTFSLTPEQLRAEQIRASLTPPSYPIQQVPDPMFADFSAHDAHFPQPPLVELFPPRPPTPPAPAAPPANPAPPRRPRIRFTPRQLDSPILPRARPHSPPPAKKTSPSVSDMIHSLQSQTSDALGRRREKERRFVELSQKPVNMHPDVAQVESPERTPPKVPTMRTQSSFGSGPMAVRGYEGEAIMFAGRRHRGRAITSA